MGRPVPDGWRNLGLGLGAAGIALIAVQLARSPGKHPWFAEPIGIVGIVALALGTLAFCVGFFMADSETKRVLEPATATDDRLRVGIRVRGEGKVDGEDTRIRNQDIAVDVAENGEFKGKRTDIS